MKGKKGIVWETLVPWIMVFGAIIIFFIAIFIFSGKGEAAVSFFRNLIRFGR